MKKLKFTALICLSFTCAHSTVAQTQPDSSNGLKGIIDWTLAPLDTSQYLNTHLLMDKGMMDSSFFWHRGKTNDSINSGLDWYNKYLSCYNARVIPSDTSNPIKEIYPVVGSYLDNDLMPIMGLWYDYNYIHPESFNNGLIDTVGGQFILTNTGNPFLTDTLFSIAVPDRIISLESNVIKFVFSDSLWFTNNTESIDSIKISINGGTFTQIGFNEIYQYDVGQIEGTDIRNIEIKLKITFVNGYPVYATTQTSVRRSIDYDEVILEDILTADLSIVGNKEAKGIATIVYGLDENNNNVKHNCLIKPLIIVEGIDFGTMEKPIGCKNNKCGEIGYEDIVSGNNKNIPN